MEDSTLHADSYIVDKNSAKIKAEDERIAFKEAEEKLRETISNDKTLMEETRQRVQRLLEEYVENVGKIAKKDYTITWRYVDADGKQTVVSSTKVSSSDDADNAAATQNEAQEQDESAPETVK